MNPPGGELAISSSVAPTAGLIGEWKLDESGGTTAADTKGDNDASVLGGATFVPAKLRNGLNLTNGASGTGGKYAQMPTTDSVLNNVQENNYTISAWYYPYRVPANSSSDNTFAMIVSKYGQHMGIVYNSVGRFVARHYLTGNVLEIAQSSDTYPDSAWYHVASVVSRTNGTVTIYVNGVPKGTENFTAGTQAREYGTTPFRIGRAQTNWAADGKVDQVRIYNVALNPQGILDLYNEGLLRFPVMMTKGQQIDLLGLPNMPPDGHMSGQSPTTIVRILDSARAAGARVTIRVTPDNGSLTVDGGTALSVTKWKDAFDNMVGVNANSYLADGTLIGLMAIDEPFEDFTGVTGAQLELLCQHQKNQEKWSQVPCFIRELNTLLYTNRPAGGTYQYVDAGWAQIADHQYVTQYNNNMQAYFQDNLDKGAAAGLGLMYGFNLINGGREVAGCAKPADPTNHNCAMSPSEIREVGDALAAIGNDQGCGVNGWWVKSTAGAERDYFFRTDIQSALQYLYNKVVNLRQGACGP